MLPAINHPPIVSSPITVKVAPTPSLVVTCRAGFFNLYVVVNVSHRGCTNLQTSFSILGIQRKAFDVQKNSFIVMKLFYTQIEQTVYASGDPHRPVISQRFLRTFRITSSKTENTLSKTESSLSKSDFFVQLPLIRVQQSEDGEYFQLTAKQASRWHASYLFSGQEIPRMLQEETLVFYCTFVLLRGHIFARK